MRTTALYSLSFAVVAIAAGSAHPLRGRLQRKSRKLAHPTHKKAKIQHSLGFLYRPPAKCKNAARFCYPLRDSSVLLHRSSLLPNPAEMVAQSEGIGDDADTHDFQTALFALMHPSTCQARRVTKPVLPNYGAGR